MVGAKKKRASPKVKAPGGSVTNRRFYTVLSVVTLILIVFLVAVALLTYYLGMSAGRTKQEVRDKDIEVKELMEDGRIKQKVWDDIPDTGDPDFWNKLHKQIP